MLLLDHLETSSSDIEQCFKRSVVISCVRLFVLRFLSEDNVTNTHDKLQR